MQAYLGSESEADSDVNDANRERFRKLLTGTENGHSGWAKDWVNDAPSSSEVRLDIIILPVLRTV